MSKLFSPFNRRILFFLILITAYIGLVVVKLPAFDSIWVANADILEEEENEAGIGEYFQYRADQMKNKNGIIPDGALIEALELRELMESEGLMNRPGNAAGIDKLSWNEVGPGNVGGRIRTILPLSDTTVLIGSVSGGLWKTTNCCSLDTTWSPINDFMANLSISSLIIDPTDTNVLYAGTGEIFAADGMRGAGVFKSIDGGDTWTQLSSTNNSNWYYVSRLAISPDGVNLLAATSTGIYHSTNDGITWTLRINGSWRDVKFDPTDSRYAVAGGRGFSWYTTNGGASGSWSAATGLPSSGRIELAYAPSSPSIVYASVDQNSGDLYKSVDGGHSYTLVNTGMNYLGTQGFYDNMIWVNPSDANNIVVGGIDMYQSTDGGVNLSRISKWSKSWGYVDPPSPHADHHVMVSLPGSSTAVLNGNDGGIYYTNNILTAGNTPPDYNNGWVYLNNTLGITQFYGVSGNRNGVIYGGSQDNGVTTYIPGGDNSWTFANGGDGGKSAADPTDPNFLYNEYIYGAVNRSSDGGLTSEDIYGTYWNGTTWTCRAAPYSIDDACNGVGNFIAPILLDPNNANRLFVGGLSLWVTNDAKTPYDVYSPTGGPQWAIFKPEIAGTVISSIAVAPSNSDIVWVGYKNNRIELTTNGGATWTQVNTNIGINNPGTQVSAIAIDQHNSNIVYAGFTGFGPNRVWRTTDSGITWTDITNNLPQAPVYALAINPINSDWIYVGTEIGIFASENTGTTWNIPAGSGNGDGPANVPAFDLQWMGGGNSTGTTVLIAGTHGRGAFTLDTTPTSMTHTYADPDLICDGNIPCYETIDDALTNVTTGGMVTIYSGLYNENVTITKAVSVSIAGDITVNDISLYTDSSLNTGNSIIMADDVTIYGGVLNAGDSIIMSDDVFVYGGLLNADESTFEIDDFNLYSGTWNAGSSQLTISGNWTASGNWNPQTGAVVFDKDGTTTVNLPTIIEGTLSFCNLTIGIDTTIDTTDDFISAGTGGPCTQFIQNGKLKHTGPEQYIINYNNWLFKDARNLDAVLLTKTSGTSLHDTTVTITSNLTPPSSCSSDVFPGQPVFRTFDIAGTDMGGTYTTRLYFSANNPDESNQNTIDSPYNLAIYHCNTDTELWEKFTGISGSDVNGIYVEASVNSFVGSTFAIGSDNNQTFTLNYSVGSNGTLSGTTPQTVIYYGDGTPVTAVPNTGYHFVDWSDGSTDNPRTDVNITDDLSVTANFAINTFSLNYSAGSNGSLTGDTSQTINYGENGSTVTAVPDTGYHFVDWSDGLTDNPRTDVNITTDISVTANFVINTYTLNYSAGSNGSLSGNTSQTVNYGENGTSVTAIPVSGYHFVNWSDGSTDNPRTDINVTADISVTANFAINKYSLNYSAGSNGSLSGNTSQTVNYGENGTAVTAIPDTGYRFAVWSDGSTDNPRIDSHVTENKSVIATFVRNSYKVFIPIIVRNQ